MEVDGHSYQVRVSPEGVVAAVATVPGATPASPTPNPAAPGRPVPAPLAGTVVQVRVKPGDRLKRGDLILILEAMKMETEVRSPEAGSVATLVVKAGDGVQLGQPLLTLE